MRVFVLFASLLFAGSIPAQYILNFNLFPDKSGVIIKFTVSGGSSCTGFTVLHSLDSLTYNQIGSDNTSCGFSGSEDKSFVDASPVFNQVNYYKVQLDPYIETSYPKNIFVSPNGKTVKMIVYPNPVYLVDDIITLKIFNVNNTRLIGYLYNQSGSPVRTLNLITLQDLGRLDTSGLDNGVYLIWLTDGYQTFTCKFIILR